MNYAWILEIRPGYEEEYKKRHDEIWPEMVQMLKEAGLRNYNIFRYGIKLFGYFETDDLNKSINFISNSEINKKWSEYMEPIMKVDVFTQVSGVEQFRFGWVARMLPMFL